MPRQEGELQVFRLDDVLIIKKARHSKFLYTTNDSVSIPIFNFTALLKFMLFRKLLDPKVLEEVLDDYYNRKS